MVQFEVLRGPNKHRNKIIGLGLTWVKPVAYLAHYVPFSPIITHKVPQSDEFSRKI